MPILPYSDLVERMRLFQESRVFLSAVELDIFTAVAAGASASDVAGRLNLNTRATEAFLNALVALGALVKRGGSFYNTPETQRHLVAGSPEYARPALMHTVNMWGSWSTLTEALRSGTAVARPGVEARDEQWTQSFIAAMHRNAGTAAEAVVQAVGTSGVRRMLDVGGGSGAYSIAFAKASRELRAEILDLEPVLAIARKHIEDAGLGQHVTTRPGDLTKDVLGNDYDLILLSAICHMLDEDGNKDLFRRCFRALTQGGRVVIRDFILEADKTAPAPAALFALHMLVNTRAGSTYSEQEYRSWLEAAGFRHVTRLNGDLIAATR
jgi:predicted O-methyltransferase YrrM